MVRMRLIAVAQPPLRGRLRLNSGLLAEPQLDLEKSLRNRQISDFGTGRGDKSGSLRR